MKEPLTTAKVVERASVNRETLRYYLRRGLLAEPERSSGGYRLYPADTVQRVRFIKNAQQLGFSLEEIGELLFIRMESPTACSKVLKTVEAKVLDIESKIKRLQEMQETLNSMAKLCKKNKPQQGCPILECLNKED